MNLRKTRKNFPVTNIEAAALFIAPKVLPNVSAR